MTEYNAVTVKYNEVKDANTACREELKGSAESSDNSLGFITTNDTFQVHVILCDYSRFKIKIIEK